MWRIGTETRDSDREPNRILHLVIIFEVRAQQSAAFVTE
jgi:hypothetical protein